MSKINIVAEVGCNHQGNVESAFELIRAAADCGCDVVKFQKRENRLLLTPSQYKAPHPVPENSFGTTYGEHRERLEFTASTHRILMAFCEEVGIQYSCSVWDTQSAMEIKKLNPQHIKIPSACNLKTDIINELAKDWDGVLHVSMGMINYAARDWLMKVAFSRIDFKSVVFYHCTSGYPIEYKDAYLLEIGVIRDILTGAITTEDYVGYSGHHLGTDLDLVAVGAGATWIERHFTLDKKAKGTDHSASLDYAEMKELVEKIRSIEDALEYKRGIPEVEEEQIKKLRG